MKYINKLVRDNIPQIIKENGHVCSYHIINESELQNVLDDKLNEEVQEFFENHSVIELVDILEVVEALSLAYGVCWNDLFRLKEEKRKINGSFSKRVFLDSVD